MTVEEAIEKIEEYGQHAIFGQVVSIPLDFLAELGLLIQRQQAEIERLEIQHGNDTKLIKDTADEWLKMKEENERLKNTPSRWQYKKDDSGYYWQNLDSGYIYRIGNG